jgi:hypothetical protein
MSHIVTVQTRLHDPAAVAAACQHLGLPAPTQGTARLYGGDVAGLLVQLPGWHYPAVIDPLTGAVRYDTYGGRWGEPKELDRFLQAYAVEKCRIEARRRGHGVIEQAQPDGSIRLKIVEGG